MFHKRKLLVEVPGTNLQKHYLSVAKKKKTQTFKLSYLNSVSVFYTSF